MRPLVLLTGALLAAGCLESPATAPDESLASGSPATIPTTTPSATPSAPPPLAENVAEPRMNDTRPTTPPPPEPPSEAAWQGQDSEFGSIRAPYEARASTSARAPIEARVVLRTLYEEQKARFFLFAWDVQNTPLDVRLDGIVRMDTNESIACFKDESTNASAKCFLERARMPPAGTELRMWGSVGSSEPGRYFAGALVVPFTHTWTRVEMTNGLNAELYAGTMLTFEENAPQPS